MGGKRTLGAAAVTVAVTAAALAGMALAARDDPRQAVAAVDVGTLAVPASAGPSSEPAGGRHQVAALDSLEGTLERRGDDADDFSIGVVELEFGPEDWVRTAGALDDYDRDGTPEKLLDELEGLVGQPVTVLVRLDDDGDEADVFELNGLRYRDSAGPLPWPQAGTATGDAASLQEVSDAAAAAVGPGARVRELDLEQGGAGVAWAAEVIAQDGQEWDVLLDVAGKVLDAGPDD